MHKMKKFKLYIAIVMPIFIGIITFYSINKFLDKEILKMLNEKELSYITNEYGSIYKDKGVLINEYFSEQDTITIQGSSELASDVSQLPSRFFPIEGLNSTIVTNGRAYVQALQHATILGSQDVDLRNSKVAIIISLQWFENPKGIDCNSFSSTFSPVQFYNFLNNQKLSDETKEKYALRVSELLSSSSQFAPEKLYATMYINDNIISQIGEILFKPYFFIREKVVASKDKGLLYRRLKELPEKGEEINKKEVNWSEEYVIAEQQGRAAVTNNDFYVNDKYYDANLKDKLNSQKDISKNIDLMISREFEDYNLYLDVCEELGIDPYIIIMPTNGLWYDYKGMTKEKRDQFYDEIEKIARDRNFEVLNLKDEEYTPYFMTDVMHLGWKGWLKVDEAIFNEFK